MREMVLNHASLPASNRHDAIAWLKDIAVGMAELVNNKIVTKDLRTSKHLHEIHCYQEQSLFDSFVELLRAGSREEATLLLGLVAKTPILSDVESDVEDRFLRCQEKTLAPEDSEPLLFCAITDGITVGFPSEPTWDCDELTVSFDELLPDDNLEEVSETIDNLARSLHVPPIYERHRAAVLSRFSNAEALWNSKEAFSSLIFHANVKSQLEGLPSTAWTKISTALNRMDSGNQGDAEPVGGGVSEVRLHFGPGYRIYFGQSWRGTVILGCGTKRGQNSDIRQAHNLWREYQERDC